MLFGYSSMLSLNEILFILRFITGFCILFYASYTDIKTRRAPNILWVIMGVMGALFLIVQVVFTPSLIRTNLFDFVFIPIMIGLMYLFFQLRLIFGGADAKALMALALLVPFPLAFSMVPLYESILPTSWVVFANSVILFLCIPIGLFLFNVLIKRSIGFPYVFLGYQMPVEQAKKKFVWPLEKIVEGKRKFVYYPTTFDDQKIWKQFEEQNIKEVWVTPKIPFMIPLLAGFVCTFFIGDILVGIMQLFL